MSIHKTSSERCKKLDKEAAEMMQTAFAEAVSKMASKKKSSNAKAGKSFKEINRIESAAKKAVGKAKEKLAEAKRKINEIRNEWPRPFRCKECGLAFKVEDLGYKEYEELRTDMRSQYGGEYDIWQVKERKFSACCPVCGKDFKVEAAPPVHVGSTNVYGRWEAKPDFKKPYSKCVSKGIKKVCLSMVKHINSRKHVDWV